MITIITGAKNTGKTATMVNLYRQLPDGDGIVSLKIFNDGAHTGYEFWHLRGGISRPFCETAGSEPPGWDERTVRGRYTFSESGFRFVDRILEECLSRGSDPLFIDEIGPLELRGKGISVLPDRLASGRDIFCTVRESCLDDFISGFGLAGYAVRHSIENPESIYRESIP